MHRVVRTALLFLVILPASIVTALSDTLPATRLFQVVLIEAATSESLMPDGIPQSAMRALDDMKDFLPYKGYRLLDSALVRTADSASTSLKGHDGSRFEVDLIVSDSDGEGDPDLFFRRFAIRMVPGHGRVPQPPVESSGGAPASGEPPVAPPAPKTIISTSFGMNIGETVIVGSSRLNGDERALVALVTALP